MNDVTELLAESVEALLDRHCDVAVVAAAEPDGWSPELWGRLESAELAGVGVAENRGGAGGGLVEAATIVWQAARYAAPVPLAETCLLAGPLLAEAGVNLPAGPVSAGVLEDDWAMVPYGRCAALIALVNDAGELLLVGPAEREIDPGVNLAGEPRDRVRPLPGQGSRTTSPVAPEEFRRRAALMRAVQIAGTLEAVMTLSYVYAGERRQFGTPLNRFQAVQELLATIAEESAAAGAAVRVALKSPSPYLVAAAKARASEAAGAAAQRAHQVHGAIGFTHEHALHLFTRRLWSWREEYGTEALWGRILGEIVMRAGPTGLWPMITGEGGR